MDYSLKTLADIGYDGVELCLEHDELNPDNSECWKAVELRRFLRDIRLLGSAVSFHGKRENWEVKLRKCQAGIEIAAEMGIDTFITGSIIRKSDADFSSMCRFSEKLCRFAQEYNIFIAVEPEPGTLISNSQMMESLLKEVNSPLLKINLDLGHLFLTEGDVTADIQKWRQHIVHLHFEDIKGSEHRHLLPGDGDMDLQTIVDKLQEIDYIGFITLDLFEIKDNPEYYATEGYHRLWTLLQD